MALSLYELTVPTYVQALDGALGFVAKGRLHFNGKGVDLDDVLKLSLSDDMWGFDRQLHSVAHHSVGAMRAVLDGAFAPPQWPGSMSFDGLIQHLQAARDEISALDEETVNARSGGDIIFSLGDMRIPFTTEEFVISFSLPNLYFHITTAYDLLRREGVALGKRDYTGRLRIKS